MVVKQGVSFKSIMSTAKDNIKGVWGDQEETLFLSVNGASYGGKGSHRGDSSFQHHRLVHANFGILLIFRTRGVQGRYLG